MFYLKRAMALAGRNYQRLFKIPGLGEPLVRGINRVIARISFYSPIFGLKHHDSMEGFKEDFIKLAEMTKLPVEIIEETVGPGRFEFYVHSCPYGYHRPDQQGVCDAAMDMDRVLFRLMGAELVIEESAVSGAPRCRISMNKI